jgi:uncharacterized protein
MTMVDIPTPHGPARAHIHAVRTPKAALLLGHGAGGGPGAGDLTAASEVAQQAGVTVALIEQPYRVAGRRSVAPTAQLDTAWLAIVDHLRAKKLKQLPLIFGGRSSGARVACRTASSGQAVAVLCLAFPLHPPGRANDPTKSRLPELDSLTVPALIVQGERDPFGMPPAAKDRTVVTVPGDHSLRSLAPVRAAVAEWLAAIV